MWPAGHQLDSLILKVQLVGKSSYHVSGTAIITRFPEISAFQTSKRANPKPRYLGMFLKELTCPAVAKIQFEHVLTPLGSSIPLQLYLLCARAAPATITNPRVFEEYQTGMSGSVRTSGPIVCLIYISRLLEDFFPSLEKKPNPNTKNLQPESESQVPCLLFFTQRNMKEPNKAHLDSK